MEAEGNNKSLWVGLVVIIVLVVLFILLRGGGDVVETEEGQLEESAVETDSLGSEIFAEVGGGVSESAVPETNPFDNTETNPFNNIKNPFE